MITPVAPSPGWANLLPQSAADPLATAFLSHLEVRGLSRHTVLAYGRALEGLIQFSGPLGATRLDVNAVYGFLAHLKRTPSRQRGAAGRSLAGATIAQRIIGLRAYADYLVDCGLLQRNPVARGSIVRTPMGDVIPVRRGLVSLPRRLPRLPTDDQWTRLLDAVRARPARDRLMLMLAYDGALRRNELVTLRLDDFDFSARFINIRAEQTKGGYERTVIYSSATGEVLRSYLPDRRKYMQNTPFLFLSDSPRNRGRPIGGYTWGLLAAALARQADVAGFSTHTLRHMRLTDLARAGLDIPEIARFAGHRSLESTMLYIHLSGRDMARAFERASRGLIDRLGTL